MIKMNKYTVIFEENGDEYRGTLEIITPLEIEKLDDCTIKIGFTTIKIDEPIIDIKEGIQEVYKRDEQREC